MTSKQSYFTNPQLQQAKMYPTGFPLINLHICKIKTSMPIFNYNYSFYKAFYGYNCLYTFHFYVQTILIRTHNFLLCFLFYKLTLWSERPTLQSEKPLCSLRPTLWSERPTIVVR